MSKQLIHLRSRFWGFFRDGHHRSVIAKKNVAISFFLKGGSILVSLALVPITIGYVDKTVYGLWLTLSSIVSWFTYFDVGLGNGLKNKLTQAIAEEDIHKARAYVSTAYTILASISLALLIIFLIANQFIKWTSLLNAPISLAADLSKAAMIVFFVFSIQFVLQLINVVSFANQNTKLTALLGFLGNLLGLVLILIVKPIFPGSLTLLCLSIGISPLLILTVASIKLYTGKYRDFRPSFRLADKALARDILQLGIKFFIIQLGVIFFYNTDNILISHFIGPSAVTSYNIAYKYFGVITMISGIVMTPFWPAFTDAHFKNDTPWIRKTVAKLQKICLLIFGLGIIMFFMSNIMYRLWVGDKILVPRILSLVLMFYVTLNTFRTIFSYYSSAVNKITIQLIIVLTSGLLNIPLGIYLAKRLGTTGVILSTTLLCVACAVVEVIQYQKILNSKARGIWNR